MLTAMTSGSKQYIVTTTRLDGTTSTSVIRSVGDLATVTGEQHSELGVIAVDPDGMVIEVEDGVNVAQVTVIPTASRTPYDRTENRDG